MSSDKREFFVMKQKVIIFRQNWTDKTCKELQDRINSFLEQYPDHEIQSVNTQMGSEGLIIVIAFKIRENTKLEDKR